MEIPSIIDAVVKAGVNIFAFSRYVPGGGELDAGMTPGEYRELLAMCDKKFKEYEAAGCDTYFNKKDHLWTLYEYETGAFKIPETAEEGMIYGGCNCGTDRCFRLPSTGGLRRRNPPSSPSQPQGSPGRTRAACTLRIC